MGVFCPVFPGRSGVATRGAGGRQESGLSGRSVSSVRNQAQPRVKESGWKSLADKMRAYKRRVKQYFADHKKDTFGCVFSKKNTASSCDENHTGPSSRQRKTSKSESAYLDRFPEASKEQVQSLLEDEASYEDFVKIVEETEKYTATTRAVVARSAGLEEKICGKRKAGCFLSPGSRQQKISKLDIFPLYGYEFPEAPKKQLQPVSGFAAKRQEIDEKYFRLKARSDVARAQSVQLAKADAAACAALEEKKAHREDKIGGKRKSGFFLGQLFPQRKTRKADKSDIVHPHRLPEGSEERIDQLVAVEQKVAGKRKAGFLPLIPLKGQRHLENGRNGEVSLVMPGYGGKIGVLKQPVVDPESGKIKEDTVEWLVEEADFLKQLSHKHIVRVLSDKCDETDNESGEKSRETLLVTKLAGSANLEQLKKLALSEVITRNNDNAQVDLPVDAQNSSSCLLPVELLQRIMVQVASALDYLHKEKTMVHGNVATRNIVIAPDGHVSLCDFGSAVNIDDSDLPPEVWLSQFGPSDSWNLGGVLYELAFGYVQVKATDPVLKDLVEGETLESHLDEKIEGISSSRSRKGLSPQQARDLKDLLMQLLQSDPWDRISMEDVLEHPFLREAAQTAKEADQKEAEQRKGRQREALRRVGDSWQP